MAEFLANKDIKHIYKAPNTGDTETLDHSESTQVNLTEPQPLIIYRVYRQWWFPRTGRFLEAGTSIHDVVDGTGWAVQGTYAGRDTRRISFEYC